MKADPTRPLTPLLEPVSLVEQELAGFLERRGAEIVATTPEALPLVEELQRVVSTGGKRLRPLFCAWGYRAGGGTNGRAIARAGAAIELLHTAAIIHDDLLDGSPTRRGAPATFLRLASLGGREDPPFGRAGAFLVGHLAQALADELLATAEFRPDLVLIALGHFNRARVDAVTGEFVDLAGRWPPGGRGSIASAQAPFDEGRSRRVAALKTGSYTVVGPLLVGATLAEADAALCEALSRYGRPLGEAFQLRDDILGTFGDPDMSGKDRDTDIREGRETAMLAKAWRLGSKATRRLIRERVGVADLTPEGVEEVRASLRGSGALAETIELVLSLAGQAKRALESVRIPGDARSALEALADLIAIRDT